MTWLHSALRQFTNRHKELGKGLRKGRLEQEGEKIRDDIDKKVEASLHKRGVEDLPRVQLIEATEIQNAAKLRGEGVLVFGREEVVPLTVAKRTSADAQRRQNAEKKAVAVIQILHGWNLLGNLSYVDQQELIKDIVDVVLTDQ